MLPIQDDDQEDAATSDNRSDTGQSPLAQSPTPFDDDSDDSGAPTVIADSDTGQLDSELDVGLDYLTPFTAVGTVGSRQGDVAEASGSSVAAPAATSSSAMPGSDRCQSPLAQSPTPLHEPMWLQHLLHPVQLCLLLWHLWPCPLQHPWLQPLMLMSLRSRSFQ